MKTLSCAVGLLKSYKEVEEEKMQVRVLIALEILITTEIVFHQLKQCFTQLFYFNSFRVVCYFKFQQDIMDIFHNMALN